MGKCGCEDWTIREIAEALQDGKKGDKRIVVPMFQRGKRWNNAQERAFIDSMEKSYPVGTMLFYKKIEDDVEKYILVDGLQRGNTIRKFMSAPTTFFTFSAISEDLCKDILSISYSTLEEWPKLRQILGDAIQQHKNYSFEPDEIFGLSQLIINEFKGDINYTKEVIKLLGDFFKERNESIDRIAHSIVPVIVYEGKEETLPDIFSRINSKGTPLNQYELYAASWPVEKKFHVTNENIVEAVIKKYDSYVADGYIVDGYNGAFFLKEKELNAYEYVFGLGKFLSKSEEILHFYTNEEADTANPISFQLLNACFNDTDKTDSLFENIYSVDTNTFTKALLEAIRFVSDCINPITRFKANKHNNKQDKRLYHSQYQIMSMISASLREMYQIGDYTKKKDSWDSSKAKLKKNLQEYYIYDIITNYWSDGGTKKIFRIERYNSEIDATSWSVALDSYFESSLQRVENKNKKPASPSNEDYVILNAIYLKSFSAMDQLSMDTFDVEHIAPKKQLTNLIANTSITGLPISSIANLCYLPDYVNRSKKDKNFYQDKKYLEAINQSAMHLSLSDIEEKYSFTTEESLAWMDMPYSKEEGQSLKELYFQFCRDRYRDLKYRFFDYLGLDLDSVRGSSQDIHEDGSVDSDTLINTIEEILGTRLVKKSKKYYVSNDNKVGICITTSKPYSRSGGKLYWYAYRENDALDECQEIYYIWTHKDNSDFLIVPNDKMKEMLSHFLPTLDEDGNIKHIHVKYVWYEDGRIVQLASLPSVEEIDVHEFAK